MNPVHPAKAASAVAAAVVAAVLTGCSPLIYVEHVGADHSARQLGVNALTASEPSAMTRLVLNQYSLGATWEDDPRAALVELQRVAVAARERGAALALAELSFLAAREEDDRDLYLTSACWAWFCLFDTGLGAPFHAYDPRTRLSCRIYNRGLAEALKDDDRDGLRFAPGERRLVAGRVRLAVDLRGAGLDLTKLARFLPADEFEVHGLANRYRQSGLGVALIAARRDTDQAPADVAGYLMTARSVAANCLLRLDGGVDALAADRLTGIIELRQPSLEQEVQVAGRTVPLEYDISANIAYFVADSRLFDLELPEFLGGDDAVDYSGLYVFGPYQPGKVPVVFVHGTASSLARWAGMVNDLFADPVFRRRVQPWFFAYRSGEPVLVSADRLKTSLEETRRRLDPDRLDSALDHVVVLGHSQGGLLARHLVARDPDRTLWGSVFNKPFDELDMSPETRALVQRLFFSDPLPFIGRVIYIATPHRGSFLADRWYTRFFGGLIRLPRHLAGVTKDLFIRNLDSFRGDLEGATPSSVLGMRTDNPYLTTLADLPVATGVRQHCIVAIDGHDDPPDGDDGVVAYRSAAIAGADSLYLVRDKHSCQSNPQVVQEVRRILHEHLVEMDRVIAAESAAAGPAADSPGGDQ